MDKTNCDNTIYAHTNIPKTNTCPNEHCNDVWEVLIIGNNKFAIRFIQNCDAWVCPTIFLAVLVISFRFIFISANFLTFLSFCFLTAPLLRPVLSSYYIFTINWPIDIRIASSTIYLFSAVHVYKLTTNLLSIVNGISNIYF